MFSLLWICPRSMGTQNGRWLPQVAAITDGAEAAGAGYQQRSGQELGRLQSLAGDITVRTSSVSDGRGRSA